MNPSYQSQLRAVAARLERGERIAGYKIGCVSPALQRQLGLGSPVFGHIFAGELHASGSELDAAHYRSPAVEGELAVRIAEDAPRIASVFPVIELHHYDFPGGRPTAEELIASNAMQAGVVMPDAETPLGELEALRGESLQVWRNGELLGVASGEALPEQVENSIAAVAGHLGERGLHLTPGQIVLTGSSLPLYRVAPGDRIRVEWRGQWLECSLGPNGAGDSLTR